MTYYVFLSMLIITFLSVEIYLIGKYISIKYEIFKFNEAGAIMLGGILYFVISFFSFFFFTWIKVSIWYMVAIFFLKEPLIIAFLVIRRDVLSKMKVNWLNIATMAVATIILPLIYNLSLNESLKLKTNYQTNTFETWFTFKRVLSSAFQLTQNEVNIGPISHISTMLIYCAVASMVIEFSKKKNWVDYLIALALTIGLTVLFSFGWTLDAMLPIFLLLFGVLLSSRIISKSRRRYAVTMGLLDIAMWFLNPKMFFTLIILSIITGIIYTLLNKDKATLIWVQLLSPLMIVGTLWISEFSTAWAVILAVFATIAYVFMINVGRLELLDKINAVMSKYRIVVPIIYLISIMAPAFVTWFTTDITAKEAFLFDDAIFQSFGDETWNTVQSYLYYVIGAVLIILIGVYIHKKKLFISYRIVIILVSSVLLLGYTFIIYIASYDGVMHEQFKYIRAIAFLPLMIVPFIKLRTLIKV